VLLRPSNNRQPRSIAWLQCIGSRDQKNTYCSSICCMYATKEAILAKQRLGKEVDCHIFIMDERAFNKEYSAYFARARQEYGVRYTHCRVSSIQEDPLSHELILSYAEPGGQLRQERVEMAILATGLQPPGSARHFTDLLDLELNEYGFCRTDKFTPLQTSHSGVYVCGAFSSPKEISETILDASGAAAEVMRLLNERLNTYPVTREWPFLSSNNLPPERDVSGEAPKVGVYACSCGGTIGETLDLPGMASQAAHFEGVAFARVVDFACFTETIQQIQQDIQVNQLNRVVIAACSNRTHDSLFQRAVRQAGLNPYLVELVNLKVQCSRVHRWQSELANRKGLELVRIGIGRALLNQAVHKKLHRCRPSVLVIGGGVAGMTAALAIADSGYQVHLVERSEVLGGNLQNIYYVAEGYNPRRLGRDLINRVRAHQNIRALTRTEVVRSEGHAGFFRSELKTTNSDGSRETFRIEHGVTIVATGGKEGGGHPWLSLPHVITQQQLEEKIIHNPKEIAAAKDVVMIQCVQPPGVKPYCSRVCCTNTIKNAIRLKLFNPGCNVSVLYKNIVTYGFREEFYNEARKLGVVFIRYTDDEPPQVEQVGDEVRVRVRDLALNRWLNLRADLVPLSMSVVPAEGNHQLAEMLGVPLSSEGFFAEAQMKLRPMDFMREGIFLAGMAHYPKFIEESISQALAAAARALTLLSQGDSLYLGGVVAVVDPNKCVGCLTCTRTCPFGIPKVIQEEGRHGVGGLGGAAFIDAAQCQGCGTCTGECPANAIQLVNYSDEQIMLHSIHGLGSWLTTDY
jgi:heterodisulfide reductase subunit A